MLANFDNFDNPPFKNLGCSFEQFAFDLLKQKINRDFKEVLSSSIEINTLDSVNAVNAKHIVLGQKKI